MQVGTRTRAGFVCVLASSVCLTTLAGCPDPEADPEADTETDSGDASSCGPSEGVVAQVIDGDTVKLESGETVRYLMIDTPESTFEEECWGAQAKAANEQFVAGQTVSLTYDLECEDDYGRLLAYVSVGQQVINEVLVERGHACVLHIPPNGEQVADAYEELEYEASQLDKGLWAACDPTPCG